MIAVAIQQYQIDPIDPELYSRQLNEIVMDKLLAKLPQDRAKAAQLLRHPYVKQHLAQFRRQQQESGKVGDKIGNKPPTPAMVATTSAMANGKNLTKENMENGPVNQLDDDDFDQVETAAQHADIETLRRLVGKLVELATSPSAEEFVDNVYYAAWDMKDKGEFAQALELANFLVEATGPGKSVIGNHARECILRYIKALNLKSAILIDEYNATGFINELRSTKVAEMVELRLEMIELLRSIGKNDDFRIGQSLKSLSNRYCHIAHPKHPAVESLTKEKARELALQRADEAIEFYTKQFNPIDLAAAYRQRAVVESNGGDQQVRLEFLNKALDLLMEHHVESDKHIDAMAVLYNNFGNYYEDEEDFEKAYDYYHKQLQLRRRLHGSDHPRSQKVAQMLEEPTYKKIAQERANVQDSAL